MGYYILLMSGDTALTEPSLGVSLLDGIVKLAAFIFVIFLAYYSTKLLGKARGVRKGANLTVIEAIGVGSYGTIQLVKAGERFFLISVTREKISLISEIDPESLTQKDETEISPLRKMPIPFESYLNKYFKKDDGEPGQKP